jgi:hypothetical protein
MRYDRMIIGYHGCARSVAEAVVAGRAQLQPSDNSYDWLGRGIYFWEFGYRRACEWAAHRFHEPAVIGAVIQLGECFDLLDAEHTDLLAEAAKEYFRQAHVQGLEVPENTPGGGRFRDCAVLNATLDALEEDGWRHQTVRCVWREGNPVADGMSIWSRSHIQVAVRDPACIIGYFWPREGAALADAPLNSSVSEPSGL